MEFHEAVNLKDVSSYLEGEIKEKSIRYIDLVITKISLENSLPLAQHDDDMEKKYNKIKEMFGDKKEEECQEIFNKLSEDDKRDFNAVSTQKLNEEALINVINKIKEKEELLSVIVSVKKEVDQGYELW